MSDIINTEPKDMVFSPAEGRKLQASLNLSGVERIGGINVLAGAIHSQVAEATLAEEAGEPSKVVIDAGYAPITRQLVHLALKTEMGFIQDLSGRMPDAAMQRLDSEHGPHTLIGMFRTIAAAEAATKDSVQPSIATNTLQNWGI
jgi:hypothetical protein